MEAGVGTPRVGGGRSLQPLPRPWSGDRVARAVGADRYAALHTVVITGSQPDAPYILDGLLDPQTSVRPREIMTDTAGLDYCNDQPFRRRILTQLNRGESRHALARDVCHGYRGELRQR